MDECTKRSLEYSLRKSNVRGYSFKRAGIKDNSYEEWTNFEGKLKTLPLTNKNARDFVRFFLSGAVECEIDKQGRFLIPGNLRTYAILEKEIIIIGVGTRIEIWNREEWKKYSSDENISADEIAENMTMLGI